MRYLIRDKKRAHKVYKTSNLLSDYLTFSSLRSQCKLLTKDDYRAYVATVENSVRYDVKNFWNFVNAKRGNNGLPSTMHHGTYSASSPTSIANLFATYFDSVYASPMGQPSALIMDQASNKNLNLHSLSISIGAFSPSSMRSARTTARVPMVFPLCSSNSAVLFFRDPSRIFLMPHLPGEFFPRFGSQALLLPYSRLGSVPMLVIIGPLVNYLHYQKSLKSLLLICCLPSSLATCVTNSIVSSRIVLRPLTLRCIMALFLGLLTTACR